MCMYNCGLSFLFHYEPRLEAGSNASNIALRVVGGDENGAQCLRL
jgi:hypothetical protein